MKRVLLAGLMALAGTLAHAQTHQVNLTWTASVSQCVATAGASCPANTGATLVNVYRATVVSDCGPGMTWTQLATGAGAGGPYVDTGVVDGVNYCYEVRAYFVSSGPGVEGASSNWAYVPVPLPASAKPAGVTGLRGGLQSSSQ
jgi:hypothetical protein